MSQQNLLQLAKQGNPDAIAALINRKLQPKGITANISREGNSLEVVLKAEKVPHQDKLTQFIQGGLKKLGVTEINSVRVAGQKIGDESPAWEQMISFGEARATQPTFQQENSPPAVQDRSSTESPKVASTSSTNSNECPQCHSSNIHIVSDEQAVCQDCANVFEPTIKESELELPKTETPKANKLKSFFSSWGKTEYAVIGVIGILLVGAVGSLLLNRDPYICSKKRREQVISVFDPIISNWDDANDLASSTSRINLATPVSNLQNIQKEVRGLEIPECAQPVKDNFLDMSQETIDSYLLFMRDESDSIVQDSIRSAGVSQDFFIKYYSRLKEGKTLDQQVVHEVIYEELKEDTDQIRQDTEQLIQELENK